MAYQRLLHDLLEEITCSVCLEPLNNPQQLLCLHTLCLECALNIAEFHHNTAVECPTCRNQTQLTELQRDHKMDRLVQIWRTYPASLTYNLTSAQCKEEAHHLQEYQAKENVISKTVSVSGWVQKMVIFGDCVVCLTNTTVDIYNSDTGHYKDTLNLRLWLARSIAVLSSELLVIASWYPGLIIYNVPQKICTHIKRSNYHDVTVFGKDIIALTTYNDHICMHKMNQSLTVMQRLQTELIDDGSKVTFTATSKGLYICQQQHHCIHSIDRISGQVLQSYGQKINSNLDGVLSHPAGHLCQPIICESDGQNILVADYGNRRLQMLNCHKDTWDIIAINGVISKPTAATSDRHTTLYVSRQFKWLPVSTMYIVKVQPMASSHWSIDCKSVEEILFLIGVLIVLLVLVVVLLGLGMK